MKKELSYREWLLCIAMYIYIVVYFTFGSSMLSEVWNVKILTTFTEVFLCGACLVSFISRKNSVFNYIFYALLISLGLVIYLKSDVYYFILLVTMIFSIANLKEFNRLVKVSLIGQIQSLLVVILLYAFNYIEEFQLIRDSKVRHSLGFTHPNVLGTLLFSMTMAYFYLRRNKLSFVEIFSSYLFVYLISEITGSRTSAVCLFISITVLLVIKISKNFKISRKIFMIYAFSFPVATFISYYLGILYGKQNTLILALDRLFSRRLYFINWFLNLYPIKPFGQKLLFVNSKEVALNQFVKAEILDNSYISIILRFGLVLFIVIVFANMLLSKILKEKNMLYECVFLILFIIFGFFETYYIYFQYNFTILLFFLIIQKINKKSLVEDS
ncbi:hypothetical protein [Enterococcus sp. 5H]|uniref:hypothetical protein n=1 Tax=Enterococcus sp. 5H TaxID=1229490 RepID=UPI0023043FEF|nr:hypothetical protein [Enterococcus sp. 5H]MDA9471854.1 Polysaccharide polymerase [Enterococcus sp. 5H]